MDNMSLNRLPTILHTESSLGWGGQEMRIVTELSFFHNWGFRTVLIASPNSEILNKTKNLGIEAYGIRFKNKATMSTWWNLFKVIKKIKPDILNTHSSDDAWIAGVIGRLLNVKLIVRTRHVSTPIGSRFSYANLADVIITTSKFTKENLIKSGISPYKIQVVPTGINAKKYRFQESHRIEIRKMLKVEDESILIGNICVLRSWKGLDFFIDVAETLPPAFKFILVGDGPQRERLQNKVKNKNLNNKIIFLGHQEDVHKYLSALDIFFFTSYKNEGIPQSLLQARANGVFVVAAHTEPILEALEGYYYYLTVPYGDLKRAANIFLELASKSTLPSLELRAKEYQRVEENFSIVGMIRQIIKIYLRSGIKLPMNLIMST